MIKYEKLIKFINRQTQETNHIVINTNSQRWGAAARIIKAIPGRASEHRSNSTIKRYINHFNYKPIEVAADSRR